MLHNCNPASDRWTYLVYGTEKDHYQFLWWVHFPSASVRDLPHLPCSLVWESPRSIENYPKGGVHVSYTMKPCAASSCSIHTHCPLTLAPRVSKTHQILLIDLSFAFCQCKNPCRSQLSFITFGGGPLVCRKAWTHSLKASWCCSWVLCWWESL